MKQNLILLTVLLTALSAFSAEYFVDVSRPDDSGAATNWATAKQTIQAAVNLTKNSDIVWVTNGTYSLSAEISVTNAITICSVNGLNVTTVDGNSSTRCFNLSGECLVSGFTIQNGNTRDMVAYEGENGGPDVYGGPGGGIYCSDSLAVVSNCVLTGNYASGDWDVPSGGWYMGSRGGGMHQGTALNCVFSSNIATWGAGMYKGVARHCSFVGNQGEGEGSFGSSGGGGLSEGAAYKCSFIGNSALCGGGISYGAASECLFVSNNAYMGGASWDGNLINCTLVDNDPGGWGSDTAGGLIYNSIIYSSDPYVDGLFSSGIFNSCGYGLINGINGNITNSPLFVDVANGDFRLQTNSPCINWGNNSYVTNATDLAGNPRIIEGTVDMGAYEYQGTIGLADSDADGIADDWERQHGGNQNPDRVCSNGVNTLLQAYVAGLDPNDPESKFTTTVSGQTLRWNAASGRVYAVYYSTNLLDGFQPLETNIPWTAGCFTDSVHNAHGQLFYKIDVKLDGAGGGNPFLPPGGGDDGGGHPATGI